MLILYVHMASALTDVLVHYAKPRVTLHLTDLF